MADMTKHTPGPWEVHGVAILAQKGGVHKPLIGYTADHRNRKPTPLKVQEANARLMAAAPAMLAALKRIADYGYRPSGRWPGVVPVDEMDSVTRIARKAVKDVGDV